MTSVPSIGERFLDRVITPFLFGDARRQKYEKRLQGDITEADRLFQRQTGNAGAIRSDHLKAAKLAAKLGIIGAPDLTPRLHNMLANYFYEAPETTFYCLKAASTHGITAAPLLYTLPLLCSYRSEDDKLQDNIRQMAITTIGTIGARIILNRVDEFLPVLEAALPHVLRTAEQNPETIATGLVVYGELGSLAINKGNKPLTEYFRYIDTYLDHFCEINDYHASQELNKTRELIDEAKDRMDLLPRPAAQPFEDNNFNL